MECLLRNSEGGIFFCVGGYLCESLIRDTENCVMRNSGGMLTWIHCSLDMEKNEYVLNGSSRASTACCESRQFTTRSAEQEWQIRFVF